MTATDNGSTATEELGATLVDASTDDEVEEGSVPISTVDAHFLNLIIFYRSKLLFKDRLFY